MGGFLTFFVIKIECYWYVVRISIIYISMYQMNYLKRNTGIPDVHYGNIASEVIKCKNSDVNTRQQKCSIISNYLAIVDVTRGHN